MHPVFAAAVVALFAGNVKVEGMGVQGRTSPFAPGEAEAVIASTKASLKACYAAALQRGAKTSGLLLLRYEIDGEGRTHGIVTTLNGADDAFATCVADVVSALTFPKPHGGAADGSLAMKFEPEKGLTMGVVGFLAKAPPISLDGFPLPVVRRTRPLPQTKVIVRVTKTEIRVGNALPLDASAFAKDGAWNDGDKLDKQLRAVRGALDDTAVLAIEPGVSFQVAKKVIFGCNRAGLTRIAFAVRREGSTEVVALDLRELADPNERRAFVWDGSGGETVVMSSLDPALIDASIRRHLQKILDCYERELPKHPSLAGIVVVNFRIDPDGTVGHAGFKSTTMKDVPDTLEPCIAERFKAIPFPTPIGGGIVNVNYPIHFKTSDE